MVFDVCAWAVPDPSVLGSWARPPLVLVACVTRLVTSRPTGGPLGPLNGVWWDRLIKVDLEKVTKLLVQKSIVGAHKRFKYLV